MSKRLGIRTQLIEHCEEQSWRALRRPPMAAERIADLRSGAFLLQNNVNRLVELVRRDEWGAAFDLAGEVESEAIDVLLSCGSVSGAFPRADEERASDE